MALGGDRVRLGELLGLTGAGRPSRRPGSRRASAPAAALLEAAHTPSPRSAGRRAQRGGTSTSPPACSAVVRARQCQRRRRLALEVDVLRLPHARPRRGRAACDARPCRTGRSYGGSSAELERPQQRPERFAAPDRRCRAPDREPPARAGARPGPLPGAHGTLDHFTLRTELRPGHVVRSAYHFWSARIASISTRVALVERDVGRSRRSRAALSDAESADDRRPGVLAEQPTPSTSCARARARAARATGTQPLDALDSTSSSPPMISRPSVAGGARVDGGARRGGTSRSAP